MGGTGPLVISDDCIEYPPLAVGSRYFRFNLSQVRFMAALSETRDIERSAAVAGKSVDWARDFLRTVKFRRFQRARLAMEGVRNGDLAEEWWRMGLEGMRGKRVSYRGVCGICCQEREWTDLEISMMTDDSMTISASCEVCLQPMAVERVEQVFKPSREQVQFWDGIGARVEPKRERVMHEFIDETFHFVFDDGERSG